MSAPSKNNSASQGSSTIEGGARIGLSISAVVLVLWAVIALVPSKPVLNNAEQNSADAVAKRLEKVGQVSLAIAAEGPRTGEQVFQMQCSSCHASGALGAPKFGDKAAWGPRIATGFNSLWNSALKGKNSMPPQSGGQFSDAEVAKGLVYMANAGGASFPVPKDDAKPAK